MPFPPKVETAIAVLGRYGIPRHVVAPPLYRLYLRFKPDTPPPLFGATKAFWLFYAFHMAIVTGVFVTVSGYMVLASLPDSRNATKPVHFFLYLFAVWAVAGLLGAFLAWAIQKLTANEARQIGSLQWPRFSAVWRPDMEYINGRIACAEKVFTVTPAHLRYFYSALCAFFVYAVCWLFARKITMQIGAGLGVFFVFYLLVYSLMPRSEPLWPQNSKLWIVDGLLVGTMLAASVCAALFMVFDRNSSLRGLANVSVLMCFASLALFYISWALTERLARIATRVKSAEQERLLADARLHTLKAQVEPHFIFNTIAHLRSQIAPNPRAAEHIADDLSEFLRASLTALRRDWSTVREEATLCRAYLNIAQQRFGNRLSVNIDVAEEVADVPVPPLMLLTLVENAVQHGVEPKEGASTVRLEALGGVDARKIALTVSDDGAGFDDVKITGSGVGLANIRERLRAIYGEAAKLSLRANTPTGVIAEVALPIDGGQRDAVAG
jgi:Histidine kinase